MTERNENHENSQGDLSNPINSKYRDIPLFNQFEPDPVSSIGILHTNIASISKQFDDLATFLSLVEFNFQIIGVIEHKIQKRVENSTSNIDLQGYHPFVFDKTKTTHGGTSFLVLVCDASIGIHQVIYPYTNLLMIILLH